MNTFQEQLMAIKTEMDKENIDNKIIETKVEVKDISIDKQIKQVKIEVNTNTNDKNVHNNIDKDIVVSKINYNRQESRHSDIDLKDIKRGDIIWINLFGAVGSEQSSDENGRPCVCIQNNVGNAFSPTIIVSAITSQLDKAKLPTHVLIPSSENYGLTKDSVVLLEQIRTVDKRKRILRRTGHLDDLVMQKINKALSISIGDMVEKTPLERLHKKIQNEINEKLEDIRGLERTITNIKRESLIKHLMEERESRLLSLQRICEKYGLNYKDYYVMYRREEEKIVM